MAVRFSASYRAEVEGWQVIAPLTAWDELAAAGGDADSDRVFPGEASCAAVERRRIVVCEYMLMGWEASRRSKSFSDGLPKTEWFGEPDGSLADLVADQVIALAEPHGWNVVAEAAARVVADRGRLRLV